VVAYYNGPLWKSQWQFFLNLKNVLAYNSKLLFKKGFTYVKLTHEVYKHKKKKHQIHECLIRNGFYNLGEQNVMNYKVLDMDFYLTMCLCNVCETLGYKIFEV